jgi:hypothetical protein
MHDHGQHRGEQEGQTNVKATDMRANKPWRTPRTCKQGECHIDEASNGGRVAL